MKRFLYSLCLIVSLAGLSSCKDDDPAPVSPVVGRWELDRGLLTGFAAPYQSFNTPTGTGIDLYNYDYGSFASRIDIRADKSFTDNTRQDGVVADQNGTWDYTDTQLTLTYDAGGEDTYTYTSTGPVEELTLSQAISIPVSSTATSTTATATGQIQYVYRK